jgi:hypothetical protein
VILRNLHRPQAVSLHRPDLPRLHQALNLLRVVSHLHLAVHLHPEQLKLLLVILLVHLQINLLHKVAVVNLKQVK